MKIIENNELNVTMECDVFVAGGGIAGIAAALAASRQGKNVILAERMFMLGGLATAGLITIYLPLCDGYGKQVSFGLAEELLRLSIRHDHLEKRGYPNWIGSDDPAHRTEKDPRFEVDFNPQLFAIDAEQQLLSEGVKILYGTYVAGCTVENGKITHVILECKGGRQAVKVTSCVDASGDLDLGLYAGAPYEVFKQGNILASWYYSCDRNGLDLQTIGYCDIPDEEKEKLGKNETAAYKRYAGLENEEITGSVIDSHASILNSFLKKREKDATFVPVTIATIPQLRMTRRITGEYELATEEMHTRFEDSIGMVSDWRKRGPVYEVPFRTLYSKKVKNLLTAGRVTSCTEGLWDVLRVIPCCAVTGEAAGIAAAMTDDLTTLNAEELQKKLRAQGVVIHEDEL